MFKMNQASKQQLMTYFFNSNEVDLAKEFVTLPQEAQILWLSTMPKDKLADTFSLLSASEKEKVISVLSNSQTIDLIKALESDELVDALQELPANIVKRLIGHISSDRRAQINMLLHYSEGSVGSVMTVDYLAVKSNTSISTCKEKVIQSQLEADNLEEIWVIDQNRTLIGYVNLANLFRAGEGVIADITVPITVKVTSTDDREVAANLAQRYFLSAIPVVDKENKLIGSIQAEELLSILQEAYHEDMGNLHGIMDAENQADYLTISVFNIAKNRILWLIICLVTATATSFIIQRYEALLASSVALVSFIPMLMDSGGNAGSQSSTTLIRAISVGEIQFKDLFKVIIREAQIGLFVGLGLVIVNIIRILIFEDQSPEIIATVSITLLLTIMLSKVMGALLPLVAVKVKLDPTVMAGPIITTIVDTTSLIIFFEVAKLLLDLS